MEGQRFLVFDSESSQCTVDDRKGEQVEERWENDKEVTKFFTIISMGDGRKGLKLLVHWKKELEIGADPTAAPAPAQSRATTNVPTKLDPQPAGPPLPSQAGSFTVKEDAVQKLLV